MSHFECRACRQTSGAEARSRVWPTQIYCELPRAIEPANLKYSLSSDRPNWLFALTLLPQMLPLGHFPTVVKSAKSWSGRRDSNPRPRPWQGRALPLSYTRIREIGGDHSPATRRAMPNAALECNSPRAIFESAE